MKVSIVGLGKVGATLAYTLLLKGLVREMVLVGRDEGKTRGEAMDLFHSLAFLPFPCRVKAGKLDDVAGSQVIAICASVHMEPGLHHRNELAKGNLRLMREILPKIRKVAPDAIVLMVTNPVDVLTWQLVREFDMDPSRAIGTGTLLDSGRFRDLLSQELKIHPDDLRAYIIGEHGDTQFPIFSHAQAGGEKISDTPLRREMCERTTQAGVEVFHLKGHTNYAIAVASSAIIESILLDEKRTMPLSVWQPEYLGVKDVCLSVPVVIGAHGVERILHPTFNEEEKRAFCRSAAVVRAVIAQDDVLRKMF